ncbi:glycine betaine ABC transporter substrate-binding protein [Specibacter sp. RAF43]|uniref:glycine betaine ABC transporter substrate-binding protein n=1 Tax=Specibacter sp. RAF43 TaxID=3233057 RepID=UPI003F963FCD
MRLHRPLVVAAVAALLLAGTTGCAPDPIVVIPSVSQTSGTPLLVGTPAVPDGAVPLEGALVAHVYTAALNAAGVKARVSDEDPKDPTQLGGITAGTLDILPGYASAMLAQLQPTSQAATSQEVLDAVKATLPAGATMLEAAKAEDNHSIAVTAVTAEKYRLKTIADLAKVCEKIALGGSAAFRVAERGLSTLGSDYNCVPKSYVELPNTKDELLLALLRDDVQAADIHSSSPGIEDNALVVLADTKNAFRPDPLVPVVATARVTAAVRTVLNKVSAQLTSEELVNLNRLGRDRHQSSLADVAAAWLVERGLTKATS